MPKDSACTSLGPIHQKITNKDPISEKNIHAELSIDLFTKICILIRRMMMTMMVIPFLCTICNGYLSMYVYTKGSYVFAKYIIKRPRNFKIPVTAPHNTPIIMWGSDKNLKVLRLLKHKYREHEISKREFF